MAAFNAVRMRVKPGLEEKFLEMNREPGHEVMSGFRAGYLVKTGERTYCFIAEWDGMDSIVAARPAMIAELDRMRDMLEDLGGGLGVTDPVSGVVVAELHRSAEPEVWSG